MDQRLVQTQVPDGDPIILTWVDGGTCVSLAVGDAEPVHYQVKLTADGIADALTLISQRYPSVPSATWNELRLKACQALR